MYTKKLKIGTDIYKVIVEIISDKELHNKKPDLSFIYALDKKISIRLNDKYAIKEKDNKK